MKADPQFITALGRGIDVLRCFTPDQPELGSTEIASLTGLPQATVWRLCHTLATLGCLVPGRNPAKLRIGLGTLSLGQACLTHSGIAEAAYAGMKRIADRYGGSVSLAGRDRLHMVIVQRAEAPTILRLQLHVGSALALERSALGWAYYAGVDATEREEIVRAIAAAHRATPAEWRKRLAPVLAGYERDGVVTNVRTYHPEVNAIGVPVVGQGQRKVMALNCGGASTVMTRKVLAGPAARDLKTLAAELSGLLRLEPA